MQSQIDKLVERLFSKQLTEAQLVQDATLQNHIRKLIENSLDSSLHNHGVVKLIHGHFYYTEPLASYLQQSKQANNKQDKEALFDLTLPTRLQKEKTLAYVGDLVRFDEQTKTIKAVLERLSLLPRPKIANLDQVVVVIATNEPPLEPEYLDRVLCHAGLTMPCQPIICLTKIDSHPTPSVLDLYQGLGYKIVRVSNLTGEGMDELESCLLNKTSVFTGQSGVGKSSLMNSLFPELKLKVGEVSPKSTRGTHTTRHTQIFTKVPDGKPNDKTLSNVFRVVDTPGFSRLDAQFSSVQLADPKAFPEIDNKKHPCAFADCKHLNEEGCGVEFAPSRRSSYHKLMHEAMQLESDRAKTQTKERTEAIKSNSDTLIPKLKSSLRETSRKKRKQDFDY